MLLIKAIDDSSSHLKHTQTISLNVVGRESQLDINSVQSKDVREIVVIHDNPTERGKANVVHDASAATGDVAHTVT